MTGTTHTGGCQCGVIRYRIDGPLANVSICHCRMCQKATGGLFGAYGATPLTAFAWTRGAPAVFKTSDAAERGFCAACGTHLYFRYVDKPRISLSLGSLDNPKSVRIEHQYGIEGRMPDFDTWHRLDGTVTEDDIPKVELPRYKSRQHPDHDTDVWPPAAQPC